MNTKYYGYMRRKSGDIQHYRTPGSKNGVRRFQNEDGSLTPLGRRHYGVGDPRDYNNSDLKKSDDAKLARYRELLAATPKEMRPYNSQLLAARQEAQEAQQRQGQVRQQEVRNRQMAATYGRQAQANLIARRDEALQRRRDDIHANKVREAQAYARAGQANMQERRQQAADRKMSSDYDIRKKREEAQAYARAGQANMQERRQQAADRKMSSDYDAKRYNDAVARKHAELARRQDSFERARDPIGYTVKGAARNIQNFGREAVGNVQNWANETGENIQNFGREAVGNVQNWANETVKDIKDLADSSSKFISEKFDAAADYVSNTAKQVKDVVSDAATKSYNAVSNAVSSAIDDVGGFLSKLFR